MNREKKEAKKKDQKKDALDIARMDGEGGAQGASYQKKETRSKV